MVRKEYNFSNAQRGGVLASPGKTRITIMLDDDMIKFFRAEANAQGSGYQKMINVALRYALAGERQSTAGGGQAGDGCDAVQGVARGVAL